MNNKYKLTNVSREIGGVKLYQIEALKDFWDIEKWEKGGWIEKEDNLNEKGNAWVYWNAYISWKLNYIKGNFIWWDDSNKITNITDKMWSNYWKAQYVLWEFEITEQEEEKKEEIIKEYTMEELQEKLWEDFKLII